MKTQEHDFTLPLFPSVTTCAKCGVARVAVQGGVEVIRGERRRFSGWATLKCQGERQ